MAHNLKRSIVVKNAELDGVAPLADNGYLRLYDGTQAANPETAVGSQNLLAELRLGATAFGSAVAGVITAESIADDDSADATGQATWFRILASDGTTALWDGTVGTDILVDGLPAWDLIMNSTQIQAGARVSISSLTYSLPI